MKVGTLSAVVLGMLNMAAQAQTFGSFELKAKTGDPVPGTSQTLRIDTLKTPDITQGGVIAFFGQTVQATGIDILYSLSGTNQNTLGRHIAEDQATPSGDGRVQQFSQVFLQDDGTLLAEVFLENITAGGPRAVYRTTSSQQLTEVLREGKPFAANAPILCRTNGLFEDIHVERNGDIWFAPLTATSGDNTGCGRRAIYRLSTNGVATAMASLGAGISGTAATLENIFGEVLGNDQGQIFFRGRDSASSNTFWYLIRGGSVLRIAPSLSGDTYAGADETLTHVGSTTVTQYRNGSMSGIEVIRRGQNLPQGQGQFFNIRDADVSAENVVVATMELTGTAGGATDDSGIYLVDSQGVVEIAREGRPALVPNSTFRAFPDFTEYANVGPGGRVLFEARYQVGNTTLEGWFFYDRATGLREILNDNTVIQGLTVRGWEFGPRFNQRGELPMRLTLSDNQNYMVLYRLPGSTPPPPPPSFSIGPAITGAWFDPQQSGHGLFVEVLPGNQFLAWWFTFSPGGEQAWFGGVGSYTGNRAVIPLTKTTGGRFIPNFNAAAITNPAFGTLTLTYDSCNSGKVEFDLPQGYGTGSMILTRLTLPAGLSCN